MARSKYDPLETFLRSRIEESVTMTFDDVARVIGSRLPAAAHDHRAWWGNNPTNHVHAAAWLRAGFESAQVDMVARTLVFRRRAAGAGEPRAGGASARVAERASDYARGGRHPLFGALKGLSRIAADTDLTQPADPEWGGGAR